MRKTFFLLALATFCIGMQAQVAKLQESSQSQTTYQWKVAAEVGVSYSVLDTDVTGQPGTNFIVRPGFTIGITGEYNVVDNLAVGLGVQFIQRNYFYKNTGNDYWNTRYNNNFLSIPLTVGYYLIHNPYREKGLWLKPQVGIYYEYFTSMHTKGTYPMNIMEGCQGEEYYREHNSTYDFKANDNHLRRSLFGGEAGVKVGYSFGKIDAFAGYRYQYGFSHIHQDKSQTSKTARRNSSVITAGAAYKF